MKIKSIIRNCTPRLYRFFKQNYFCYIHRRDASRLDKLLKMAESQPRIYYLGITAHSNLGDMAQHYCITKWIKENYPEYELIMFESDTVVDAKSGFLKKFKKTYRKQDIVIFQSGYTTQDLGGNHEYMHRLIVDNMPEANILMMPQTIYFVHKENRLKCAQSLDKAKHMLFLARDFKSEKDARQMFPHLVVKAYPDIVTTLIGGFSFSNERKGICMCCRNDGEKYYSEEELQGLKNKLNKVADVVVTDTTVNVPYKEIRSNKQKFIEEEVEKFSYYKVVVTDRYHGTIFSIAAGTPVVIIKTTDHKVTTGADWFNGVYDDYVFVAEDLDAAYNKAVEIIQNEPSHKMASYFKENYYDKLKDLFEQSIMR